MIAQMTAYERYYAIDVLRSPAKLTILTSQHPHVYLGIEQDEQQSSPRRSAGLFSPYFEIHTDIAIQFCNLVVAFIPITAASSHRTVVCIFLQLSKNTSAEECQGKLVSCPETCAQARRC